MTDTEAKGLVDMMGLLAELEEAIPKCTWKQVPGPESLRSWIGEDAVSGWSLCIALFGDKDDPDHFVAGAASLAKKSLVIKLTEPLAKLAGSCAEQRKAGA